MSSEEVTFGKYHCSLVNKMHGDLGQVTDAPTNGIELDQDWAEMIKNINLRTPETLFIYLP